MGISSEASNDPARHSQPRAPSHEQLPSPCLEDVISVTSSRSCHLLATWRETSGRTEVALAISPQEGARAHHNQSESCHQLVPAEATLPWLAFRQAPGPHCSLLRGCGAADLPEPLASRPQEPESRTGAGYSSASPSHSEPRPGGILPALPPQRFSAHPRAGADWPSQGHVPSPHPILEA